MLIGHNSHLNNFISLYKIDRLPTKILLSGKKGIGKSLLVKHFLFNVFEDENSKLLINNETHANILNIKKNTDKKNIEVDQIRKIIKFINQSSFNNKSKFIIIDDVEYLNTNSANALLKSLEEPNSNVYFFLIYNTEMNILDTIKSRCLEYRLCLNLEDTKLIVDSYFNNKVYDKINDNLKNYYSTPKFLISLVNYLRENDNITTTYTNCWAINNGYLEDGTEGLGDGNGFKTGGSDDKDLSHNASYIRCLAVGNIYDGFDHNSNRGKVEIYNCSAYMNGRDYAFSNTNPLEELIIKNSISLAGTNSFNATTTDLSNNTWNDDFSVSEADFENLMVEELTAERQADGSLPQISFMHLVSGSDLIDAGVEVDGVEFNGTAPDLGAFEF